MGERPDPRDTRARYQRAKAAGLDRLPSLLAELAPGGRNVGGKWTGARAHWRGDRHGGSLVIWTAGATAGGWKDYATGEKGDLIGLVMIAQSLSNSAAVRWLEDRCGIRNLSAHERAEFDRRAAAARKAAESKAIARARDASRNARAMWDMGATLDLAVQYDHAVAKYFRARGCPLEDVPNLEVQSFRFADQMDWWLWPQYRREMPPGKRAFPALISKFVDHNGYGRSVHCTFVARDGAGKAPVPVPRFAKLTAWGVSTEGLFIPVSRGPANVSLPMWRFINEDEDEPDFAPDCPVIVTEGIEDAVTLAISAPDCRVIAAGSLWGVCSLPDLPEASAWILARDNDWHAGEARELFDAAVERLKGSGKPVEVIASPVGKDFNDLAQEMGS